MQSYVNNYLRVSTLYNIMDTSKLNQGIKEVK
jgi:hypothetical protein